MSSPIKIKYYKLMNQGVGVIIYPQLRLASDPNNRPWDGRRDTSASDWTYEIISYHDCTVNLANVNCGTAPFLLGANVVFGTDCWDGRDVFQFDASSNLMATAMMTGPVDGGSITYLGVQPYNAVKEAELSQLRGNDKVLEYIRESREQGVKYENYTRCYPPHS